MTHVTKQSEIGITDEEFDQMAMSIFATLKGKSGTTIAHVCIHIAFGLYSIGNATYEQVEPITREMLNRYLRKAN